LDHLKSKPRRPNLYIIAGPNGAGKTTFARTFLPQYVECLEFVNADLTGFVITAYFTSKLNLEKEVILWEKKS